MNAGSNLVEAPVCSGGGGGGGRFEGERATLKRRWGLSERCLFE